MNIEPMKASPVDAVPEDPDYLCEAKYDGWRGFFRRGARGDGAGFFSATWKAINTIPYIADSLADLPEGTILDGEIVNLSGDRQWNLAQKVCSRSKVHVPSIAEPALTYVIFDVIELKGIDLMHEKLEDRKRVLDALFARGGVPDNVLVIEELPCEQASFDKLTAEGWEGVVCKKRDSFYVPGARNMNWLKCKAETEVDVEIVGYFPPTPGSKYVGNAVGGFLFEHEGVEGRCGTGMDNALREEMHTNGAKFLNTVAVVAHGGIGDTGKLRFPTLKRLRDPADKGPKQLTMQASNGAWVERALTAEEERDDYKDKYEDAQARVQGLLKSLKPARTSGNGRQSRNYSSMTDEKLERAMSELEAGSGEAYEKALETERNGGWSVKRHEQEAYSVCAGRSMR